MTLHFEWDSQIAATNLKKHGVVFPETATAFRDPLARIIEDEQRSAEELREILIGTSERQRLLFVCFTERQTNIIRIFSARKATKRERAEI